MSFFKFGLMIHINILLIENQTYYCLMFFWWSLSIILNFMFLKISFSRQRWFRNMMFRQAYLYFLKIVFVIKELLDSMDLIIIFLFCVHFVFWLPCLNLFWYIFFCFQMDSLVFNLFLYLSHSYFYLFLCSILRVVRPL